FRGVITASNWATASPQVFGPLEKYSYTVTDFIDRHGYFGCRGQGESAEWSLRDGHTYADRSALRFEPEEPGKPKLFLHPVMDPSYDNKTSMIGLACKRENFSDRRQTIAADRSGAWNCSARATSGRSRECPARQPNRRFWPKPSAQ